MANDVEEVADLLYGEAYEAEFGGKKRGRFLVDRFDLKSMLGVARLHPEAVQQLADACLDRGLVVIDCDDMYAFVELEFLTKWRKLPTRLVEAYTDKLSESEGNDEAAEEDEASARESAGGEEE